MRYVRLGQTDLKVSAIAFGTWAFGGDWGAAERYDSDAAIGRAWRPAYGTSAPTISTSTSSTDPTPTPPPPRPPARSPSWSRHGVVDDHLDPAKVVGGVGPPPRRHVSPQEHSAVIRTTVNDHEGSAT